MADVVGQDRVVRALASAMRARRLAHALLFVGPASVGRETTARLLARGLMCERRDGADAVVPFGCGVCRACRRAQSGSHPDVIVVMSDAEAVARGVAISDDGKAKPSAEIKIDAVRELVRLLPQRPYEGRARVVIVVDAHTMNEKAQNALLKGLEEPGDAENVLILLVPGTRAVLPTIASRCQRLAFAPLGPEALRTILRMKGVADADVRAAAAAAAGATSVEAALAEGTAGHDVVDRVLLALALRQRQEGLRERLELAEGLGRDRLEVEGVLREVEKRLARQLRTRVADGDPTGGVGADVSGLDEVVALEGIAAARRDLKANGAVQLVVERMLLGTPPSLLAAPGRR